MEGVLIYHAEVHGYCFGRRFGGRTNGKADGIRTFGEGALECNAAGGDTSATRHFSSNDVIAGMLNLYGFRVR